MSNRKVCNNLSLSKAIQTLTSLALLASIGCAGSGTNTGNSDPEPAAVAESPYLLDPNVPVQTIKKFFSGSKLNVCLYGADMTAANYADRRTMVRSAIMAWVDAARPASSVPLIKNTDIVFFPTNSNYTRCNGVYDIDINWAAETDRAEGSSNGWIVLYHNDTYNVVLHELGHVFGLGDIYIEGVWSCLPGQEPTVMCTADNNLWPEDIKAIGEVVCMTRPDACARRWEKDLKWCYGRNGYQLLLGDFNGDKRTDMLCHDTTSGYKSIAYADINGKYSGTGWASAMKWCWGSTSAQLMLGDFNGDGRTDMLCHDSTSGYKWIAYANAYGKFTGTGWESDMKWCAGDPNAQLMLGDFNGDGRTDMLCHLASNGYKWISYADSAGRFNSTDWSSDMQWCYGDPNAKLMLGDFNGDKRTDMLCHMASNGYKWISLADSAGRFVTTDWQSDMQWCGGDASLQLVLGDYNGDGRTDMLCHVPSDGYKWIAFADAGGSFPGTSRGWPMKWCLQTNVQIGDLDGNGTSDFLCHSASTGYKWTAYQPK